MKGLFIELYLDEDVSRLVAELVRARGFSATTTVEAGRSGSSDEEQLEYAAEHGKALLTHNRAHFEVLAGKRYATDHPHCGIIVATRHSPYEIVRRLLIILNSITADEMRHAIVYI